MDNVDNSPPPATDAVRLARSDLFTTLARLRSIEPWLRQRLTATPTRELDILLAGVVAARYHLEMALGETRGSDWPTGARQNTPG